MRTTLALIALSACTPAPATLPNDTAATKPRSAPAALPGEVTALIDRWTNCWHFRGEEPYDADRRRELVAGVQAWCSGNDEERARLRAVWKDRADVMSALAKLDEMQ